LEVFSTSQKEVLAVAIRHKKTPKKGVIVGVWGFFWGCFREVITVCGILRLKKGFFNYAKYTVNYGILYLSF